MKKEIEIAKNVLHEFRIQQLRLTSGTGCYCDKCVESMRIALKKFRLLKMIKGRVISLKFKAKDFEEDDDNEE